MTTFGGKNNDFSDQVEMQIKLKNSNAKTSQPLLVPFTSTCKSSERYLQLKTNYSPTEKYSFP